MLTHGSFLLKPPSSMLKHCPIGLKHQPSEWDSGASGSTPGAPEKLPELLEVLPKVPWALQQLSEVQKLRTAFNPKWNC